MAAGVGLACAVAAGAFPWPDEFAAGAFGAAGAGVVCARCVCGAGAGSAVRGAVAGAAAITACAIWLTGWLTGARGGAAARVVGAAGEAAGMAAIFCAETTPKAARPRITSAATIMRTMRIVSL